MAGKMSCLREHARRRACVGIAAACIRSVESCVPRFPRRPTGAATAAAPGHQLTAPQLTRLSLCSLNKRVSVSTAS